ncbi:MAG: hypothetical protein ACJ75B_20030 [Flavisolibacter sp.]
MPDQTLHPRKWPAAIPLVLALALVIFFSPQQKDFSIAYMSGFLILLSLFMYFFLSGSSITMTEAGFVQKNLFRSTEVFWRDVSKTYIKYRHHGKSGSYFWYFEDRNENKKRFSIKLYSRSSLQTFARVVASKCKMAITDERIINMAEGNFPWYIF